MERKGEGELREKEELGGEGGRTEMEGEERRRKEKQREKRRRWKGTEKENGENRRRKEDKGEERRRKEKKAEERRRKQPPLVRPRAIGESQLCAASTTHFLTHAARIALVLRIIHLAGDNINTCRVYCSSACMCGEQSRARQQGGSA